MAYKEYYYGEHRIEIRNLLRRRLVILGKIHHHKVKIQRWEKELPEVERELNELLEHTKKELKK